MSDESIKQLFGMGECAHYGYGEYIESLRRSIRRGFSNRFYDLVCGHCGTILRSDEDDVMDFVEDFDDSIHSIGDFQEFMDDPFDAISGRFRFASSMPSVGIL